MSHFPDRYSTWALIIACLLLFAVAGLIGGPDNPSDLATIHTLGAQSVTHFDLVRQAIAVTHFGGAPILLAILCLALLLLAWARQWHTAISLSAIVLGGRLAVELLKLLVGRQRPHFGPYPVEVASLSFPSGHAANTMITFLALAMIAVPARYRTVAIVVAIAASLLIGMTRPLLGVHWPSDVIGGWAFGVAWVTLGVELSRRRHRATE